MQSTEGNQLLSPGQSLWSLITEHAPGSELPKIRTALGHSLVDMYTEVHAEAVMWYKMWQGSQRGGNYSNSRAGTPLPLADPPVIKELVRAEVRMLLQNLKERAIREGRDDEEFLFRYKPETVNYALGHLDSCTDNDKESRPSSNCSVQSNAKDEIDAVKDKLNVTDIDKVVDRLKSVLTEECEALKKQVKHLQGNIRQKCEFDKTEPTLAELKELRGAIQTDLELCPSSFTSSYLTSSPLPVKALKNRFRLSAGQRASDKTLQALTTTSVLRPHPPPALRHVNPIPPVGRPLIQNSINTSSLSGTRGQHRSTSASTGSSKTQTTVSNRTITSGHRNAHLTTHDTDKKMVKHLHHCTPEQNSAGLHRRTPTSSSSFQIKTQRNSPIQAAHLSSHRTIHSPGRECDLSPQTERNSSLALSSRNINIIPSAVHALSPLCEAGGYSSNSTDHSMSTTGKSTTQNGPQNSTRGGSSVTTTVQTHNDRKSTTESFHSYVTEKHSVLSETGHPPAQNCTVKNNNGIYRNKNGDLREDVIHQQSLSSHCLTKCSSYHPESSGTHAKPVQTNGQFFTSPKRPLEGTTSQPKRVLEAQKEQEFLNRLFQPVSPARVPT